MEPEKLWAVIGVGLLAAMALAPVAFAHMGGQLYTNGYGMHGMMHGRPANLYLTGAGGSGPGGKDNGFYDRMVNMHNSMFGTNYSAEEFGKLHGGAGCH